MPGHVPVAEVCIIGFGRLGQTLAGILGQYCKVAVYESDSAKQQHITERGYRAVGAEDLRSIETVIVCVPISQFDASLAGLAPLLGPSALVMDVCSVKVLPVQAMERLLPATVSIIATHPLFGPDSISKGYEKLSMVTHPVRVDPFVFTAWDDFWKGLGLHIINATPEEHDQATAYTLGMTHFFGRIMDELKLEPQPITTISYGALYEVMVQTNHDSWQLFRDMQHYNPYAREMRNKVYQAIQKIEDKLDAALLDE